MSSSTTLTQLINLLTRPLIFTQPAFTIAQLQLALQANLSTLFNTQPFAPFTLHLSAHALPIPPIYAACLTLGLSWESWATALSSGNDLYIFVMEGCIRVGVPSMQETVVVWKESSETKASTTTTTASKLQAMLDSARARKQAKANADADAQASSTSTCTLPTLRITPSTPLLSSSSEPSSPVSASSSSSSETDSDSDSDSDSDTESTTSSTTTVSSVSSNSTSSSPSFTKTKACSTAFGTQFFIPTTTTVKDALAIPRAQRRREWVTQSQSLASLSVSPTSRVAKATITKYTYQGGQTGVMTGGVMLGGKGSGSGSKGVGAAVTTPASGTGAGSTNWRRSVSSRRV